MSRGIHKTTIYERRALFSELLSADLFSCAFPVEASYEWKRSSQIYSLRFDKDGRILLKVNLNAAEASLPSAGKRSDEIGIRFRAYCISSFIHCLEAARAADPQSYYNGLVTLEAICCLAGKTALGFSPLAKKPQALRPIDVYCAIRALTRLQLECNDLMTESARRACAGWRDVFLLYTQLPELEYANRQALFAFPRTMRTLQAHVEAGRLRPEDCTLFSRYGLDRFSELTFGGFISACERSGNSFWGGAAMRLMAFSGSGRFDVDATPGIGDCVAAFGETGAQYAADCADRTDSLLLDNAAAVKRTAQRIGRSIRGARPGCGALHYIS